VDDKVTNEILNKLNEIELWLRFSCRNSLKDLVEETLRDEKDMLIYELTNGTNSSTVISKKAKCSQPTVINIWNRWKRLGIVTEISGIPGRCKVLSSLEELGLK